MTTLLTSDPSTLVTILGVTATLLLLANILQAVVAIANKNRATEAEEGRMYALAALKEAEEKAQRIAYDRDQCGALRARIERAAKEVEAERDWWKNHAQASQAIIATLYFRNEKGQIVPMTPKKRKPHTLKHGMTVKDPTPYQAKRIFAAARRAGIETHQSATNDTNCIWFYGNDGVNSVCAAYAGAAMTTYISASEFVRRIKGEIE